MILGLKGPNMTAQGNALGNEGPPGSALKGQNRAFLTVVVPFQGEEIRADANPGRCPGLICLGPSGPKRAASYTQLIKLT